MKKIYYLTAILLLAAFVIPSGCSDDFLDRTKLGDLTVEEFFKSEDDAMKSIVAAYSDLKDYRYQWSIWIYGDCLSDDAIHSGSDADVISFQRMKKFDYHADHGRLLNRWQICYRLINKANQVIDGISEMDNNLFSKYSKERFIAEAQFLRAYSYFELVRAFGGVPVLTHTTTIKDKGLTRTAPEKVYQEVIEKDLLQAIAVLPARNEIPVTEYGRITKGAAQGLLAKVYLYQKKYQQAKDMAWNLVNPATTPYKLMDNYGDNFTFDGEHCAESLFEITHYISQTESGATTNNGNFHTLMMLPFGATYGYGINQPTQDLYDAYEPGDTRRDATLLTVDDINRWETPEDAAKLERNRTGYYNQKFYVKPSERAAEIRNNGNNYRIMRLGEIYLIYAEACYFTGDEVNAREYLNKLRERARETATDLPDVTATGLDLLDAIYKEQRVELAMEGHRFFELVRTGRAASVLPGFKPGISDLLPIPEAEIVNSGGSIAQNPM